MPSLLGLIVLAPSASRTANGNSDVFDLAQIAGYSPEGFALGTRLFLRSQVNVTAVSGTSPSCTVVLEDSLDGTNWNTFGTFTAKTIVSREVINVGRRGDAQPAGFAYPFFHRRVRARWTITGTTPNFTFDITAAIL